MSSALKSQELAEELVDPKAFGKSGEAWVFAQVATIALLVFPPIPLSGLVDFIGVLLLTTGVVFMWVRAYRNSGWTSETCRGSSAIWGNGEMRMRLWGK